MSERSEAAQKWAEAKEALDVAQAAADAAHATLNDAVRVEAEAWEALEALAGRPTPVEYLPEAELELTGASGGLDEPTRPHYTEVPGSRLRHSLPVRPIG